VKLLLDTCAFLWSIDAPSQLSVRAREAIESPANEVYLSAISVWEIAIKHQLGALRLAAPPDRFVADARARHGFDPLPFDEEAALHVHRLPSHHRDPFDRALVAQAIAHGLAIIKPDPAIAADPVAVRG
jgi:PIN domain nuclease of toxin-antitoxin system